MTDVLTPEQRSLNMSRIRGKDTKPELIVRSTLHRLGYRFRLHRKELPGNPDIVLPKHNMVIFVHGCYWHRHRCRFGRVVPATRTDFWMEKFSANIARDRRNQQQLIKHGWRVATIWECQTTDLLKLTDRIRNILL